MIGQRSASLFALVLAAAMPDEPPFVFVCPAGFIEIAGDPELVTDDFCIMLV